MLTSRQPFVAAMLLVFTWVCAAILVPSRAAAITLPLSEFQTADAAGNSPTTGGFAGADLLVRHRRDGTPLHQIINAYAKFDLSALGGQFVESATLNLHQFHKLNNVNSADLFVARVAEPWDATTSTPTIDQTVVAGTDFSFGNNGAASAGPAVDIDHAIDVTDYVNAWIASGSNQGVRLRIDQDFVGAAFDSTGPDAPFIEATPIANAGLVTQTVIPLNQFQTAADNGESPAASGQFAGPFYVRERANENNPELEVNAFFDFDLSALSAGQVVNATLTLHENHKLNNVNSGDLFLARVTEPWDATTNNPTFDQGVDLAGELFIGDNGNATDGPVVDISFVIDVTDIVSDWLANPSSNHGFRLRLDDAFVGAAFDHDGPNAPVLTITQVSTIPEPTISALLMLSGVALLRRRRRA